MHFAYTLPLALAAALLDVTIGYPLPIYRAVGHPVVWMRAWGDALRAATRGRLASAALALYLAPAAIVPLALTGLTSEPIGFVVAALIASTLVSQQALDRRVRAIAAALELGDLAGAREYAAGLAGPGVALDDDAVSRTALDALARHFARGVVAPLFWIAVTGLAGGAVYKALEVARGAPAARLMAWAGAPGDAIGAGLLSAAARLTGGGPAAARTAAPTLADWPSASLAPAPRVDAADALRRGLALYRRAAAIEVVALTAAAVAAVAL